MEQNTGSESQCGGRKRARKSYAAESDRQLWFSGRSPKKHASEASSSATASRRNEYCIKSTTSPQPAHDVMSLTSSVTSPTSSVTSSMCSVTSSMSGVLSMESNVPSPTCSVTSPTPSMTSSIRSETCSVTSPSSPPARIIYHDTDSYPKPVDSGARRRRSELRQLHGRTSGRMLVRRTSPGRQRSRSTSTSPTASGSGAGRGRGLQRGGARGRAPTRRPRAPVTHRAPREKGRHGRAYVMQGHSGAESDMDDAQNENSSNAMSSSCSSSGRTSPVVLTPSATSSSGMSSPMSLPDDMESLPKDPAVLSQRLDKEMGRLQRLVISLEKLELSLDVQEINDARGHHEMLDNHPSDDGSCPPFPVISELDENMNRTTTTTTTTTMNSKKTIPDRDGTSQPLTKQSRPTFCPRREISGKKAAGITPRRKDKCNKCGKGSRQMALLSERADTPPPPPPPHARVAMAEEDTPDSVTMTTSPPPPPMRSPSNNPPRSSRARCDSPAMPGEGVGGARAPRALWCEGCNTRLVELKRQAVALWMPLIAAIRKGALHTQDPGLPRRLEERLALPPALRRGLHHDACATCHTPLAQLKHAAAAMVHSLDRTHAQMAATSLDRTHAQMAATSSSRGIVQLPRTTPHYNPQHHRLIRQGLKSVVTHHSSPRYGSSTPPPAQLPPHSPCVTPPYNPHTRVGHPRSSSEGRPPPGDRRGQGEKRSASSDRRQGEKRTPTPFPHGHYNSGGGGSSSNSNSRRRMHSQMMTNGSPVVNGDLGNGWGEHGGAGSPARPSLLPLAAHPSRPAPPRPAHPLPPSGSPFSPGGSSTGSSGPTHAAAVSFFARAAQKLNISSSRKKKKLQQQQLLQQQQQIPPEPGPPPFPTNFSEVIRQTAPAAPPCLVRPTPPRQQQGAHNGKVKVMLRICPMETNPSQSFLELEPRQKQVTVYDPSYYSGYTAPSQRRAGTAAPKMFAFDAVFSQDESLAEMCSESLVDIIQAVVNGADGCLFCYGHARLGKTYTMLGVDDSAQNLGIIPCAIAWLFRLINEQKERSGARFSVRVSAVEVTGKQESLKDLLADVAGGTESGSATAPGVYLRDDPICGTQLENQSELRAPTADRAAYYLDAAVAARTVPEVEEDARNSHLLFTLHVYQYRVDRGTKATTDAVAGGRSRLHLLDLGSCSKTSKDGNALTLSALGTVLLALLNGQRHVPHRESKLTQLVKESLGNMSCRTCMIAHVSPSVHAYNETLQVIQLAAKIHRMRRRKSKFSGTSSDDSSCDSDLRLRSRRRIGVRMGTLPEDALYSSGSGRSYSDPDYTSSSEQSCDTVIYVGRNGQALSDRELTDNEGPSHLRGMPRRIPGTRSSGDEGSVSDGGRSVPKCGVSSRMAIRSPVKTLQAQSASAPNSPSPVKGAASVNPPCLKSRVPVSSSNMSPVAPLSNGVGSGVVQLPRKLNPKCSKPVTSSGYSGDLCSVPQGMPMATPGWAQPNNSNAGPEQWVDGPSVSPGYMNGPGPQLFNRIAVPPPPPSSELWVDGPHAPAPTPAPASQATHLVPRSEQWVDGPSAFRVGAPCDTNSSKPAVVASGHGSHGHKMWTERPQDRDHHSHSHHHKDNHKDKPSHHSSPHRGRPDAPKAAPTPLRNPVVEAVVAATERPVSGVSQESDASMAVNATSRPVSTTLSEDPAPTEADNGRADVTAEDDAGMYPVKSFVKAWVQKHGVVAGAEAEDGERTRRHHHKHRSRNHSPKHQQSATASPATSHRDPLQRLSQDDSAVNCKKNSHSPDRLVASAQSSPRLRRIRKHQMPGPPSIATETWVDAPPDNPDVCSVTTTMPIPIPANPRELTDGLVTSPSSPPPGYEACIADGICNYEFQQNTVNDLNKNVVDEVDEQPPVLPPAREIQVEVIDCDESPVLRQHKHVDYSIKDGLDINNLLMTNRESIYELQADETLEAVHGDSNRRMTYMSEDDMSAWSTGSHMDSSDKKHDISIDTEADIDLELAVDEGILDVEINEMGMDGSKLSPLAVCADNESGIASTSGEHLSPPSSSDDSDKPPGKRLMRPMCLRRPDGASNPNLSEVLEETLKPIMEGIPDDYQKDTQIINLVYSAQTDCSVNRCNADGQSPEDVSPVEPNKSLISKLPVKTTPVKPSKLPCSPQTVASPKPPSSPVKKSMLKSPSRTPDKPAVPPRTSSRLSSPASSPIHTNKSVLSSPTKSCTSSITSPSPSLKSSSKLPKAMSPTSTSTINSHSIRSSSKSFSSLKSKLPMSSSSRMSNQASPTKSCSSSASSSSGGSKDAKTASRSNSKSPSPSKRSKESKLSSSKSMTKKSRGHTDSDSGNDSGIVRNDTKIVSPYSKLTRPRISTHSSSGHGSDASSSLSCQLPGQTGGGLAARLGKVEVSSGYESGVRESEVTGASSSNPDSSESSAGATPSTTRLCKLFKKKSPATKRSRSAPARSPDSPPPTGTIHSPPPSRTTPASPRAWVDTRRIAMGTDDPFEIKVYEFEDVERMTRRRKEEAEAAAVELHRRCVGDLLNRQSDLKRQMMEAKNKLMIDKRTWSFDLHVAEHMDRDDPGYLEALDKETAILEKRVAACKSRIMMVTCFDSVTSPEDSDTTGDSAV